MGDDSKKKDIAVGSIAVAGAALTGGPFGALAAFFTAVSGIAFETITKRDTKRASQLFERMAECDEQPADFLAELELRLREEDEHVLGALRALIVATLESLSPDALTVIAMFGRQYVRAECPAWVARGWVRLVAELTSAELDGLRDLAGATAMALAISTESHGAARARVVFTLVVQPHPLPRALQASPGMQGRGPAAAAGGHAERLFDLLMRHGLATTRIESVRPLNVNQGAIAAFSTDQAPKIETTGDAARALVRALGVSERVG